MRTVDDIIESILGKAFQIDCPHVEIRGRDDHADPLFSGPGTITGGIEGSFSFRLLETTKRQFKEAIRSFQFGSMPMRLFATDFYGFGWAGAWFVPTIQTFDKGQSIVTGEFPQLTTSISHSSIDSDQNKTSIYYNERISLPMLTAVAIQKVRNGCVESQRVYRDMCKLNFNGSEVTITIDDEKDRLMVSCAHRPGWAAPICEIGLANSLAFVSATRIQPRIAIRHLPNRALLFIRQNVNGGRTGMPPPLIANSTNAEAFWNIFLAFLNNCEIEQAFDSTPLTRMFSEVVHASTGTINNFVLTLLVTIEELISQIVARPNKAPAELADLLQYIKKWPGPPELQDSAIRVLSTNLARVSVHQHLRSLVSKGVLTEEQTALWKRLRPKIAHGKIVDYRDEDLLKDRNQLINMFYRLSLRLLDYKGPLMDYCSEPPAVFEFRWDE